MSPIGRPYREGPISPRPKPQGFGATFGRIWATFGNQINEDLIKNVQNPKTSANPKILSLFYTTASHYHHEIGFDLRFLKLVSIQNLALPKSNKHGN